MTASLVITLGSDVLVYCFLSLLDVAWLAYCDFLCLSFILLGS